jgi:hypothetical protein
MQARSPDPATGTAVLAVLAWIACVVAGNGLISVGTGLEVVPLHRAGPLAEPVAVAVTGLLLVARTVRPQRRTGWLVVECALIAYLALVIVGAVVAGIFGGGAAGLLFAADAATSVFTVVDALLAGAVGLAVLLIARARAAGAGRPRWPWERDEDP